MMYVGTHFKLRESTRTTSPHHLRLRCRGISFGYGDSDPFLVASKGNYMVVRTSPTREWGCIGESFYVPAQWFLLRVKPDEDELRIVQILAEEEPGRFWKRTRDSLIQEMERLVP